MKYLYSLLIILFTAPVSAQKNEIFSPRIATLQVVAGQNWLSTPVVDLYSNQPLNISFDDLTHEYHRYVYKIEHCEADWSVSQGIFLSDYLEGFTDAQTIDDMAESVNTNVLYTHYRLKIPNERCRIKMSGNYRLSVYDENNDNELMFQACFMVVERETTVTMEATANTELGMNSAYQQINWQLNYNNISVAAPDSQIKTVVMQNGRWDNAVINARAQFVMRDGLRWSHNRNLIFPAGNEYRKFEMLDVSHTTMGLERIGWDGHTYHAYVGADEQRRNYIYDESANGSFYIRNSDNWENDVTSEYLMVHFTLFSPRIEGDIYLNGTWTNDQFIDRYKMVYNEEKHLYEASVMLKQGYYSYQYLQQKKDGSLAPLPSEGSFYQTENQYQVLVYYRGNNDRTDRLVGYQEIRTK